MMDRGKYLGCVVYFFAFPVVTLRAGSRWYSHEASARVSA
jgi:hypothetical protein